MADATEPIDGQAEPSIADQLRAVRDSRNGAGESPAAASEPGQAPPSTDDQASPAPPWGDDFDARRAWNTIQSQRETEKQLRAEVTRHERENMSELERVKAELADALTRNDSLQRQSLRSEVAAAKGLPASALRFLDGKDQRELEANADELLALIGTSGTTPASPDFGNGARPPVVDTTADFSSMLRRAAGRSA